MSNTSQSNFSRKLWVAEPTEAAKRILVWFERRDQLDFAADVGSRLLTALVRLYDELKAEERPAVESVVVSGLRSDAPTLHLCLAWTNIHRSPAAREELFQLLSLPRDSAPPVPNDLLGVGSPALPATFYGRVVRALALLGNPGLKRILRELVNRYSAEAGTDLASLEVVRQASIGLAWLDAAQAGEVLPIYLWTDLVFWEGLRRPRDAVAVERYRQSLLDQIPPSMDTATRSWIASNSTRQGR